MQYARFDEPVTVLVGRGYPVQIETVTEAYSLLQDWPSTTTCNTSQTVALNACKAGIAGDIDPETVRATLVEFAHRNDILVPAAASLAPPFQAVGPEGRVGKKYPQ